MPDVDLNKWKPEVESGLSHEIREIEAARERQDFYDFQGARWERRFRRDAESSFDFQGRSHRQSGFLRECVGKLCAHLYSPGPARRWSDNVGDEFLQGVYQQNLINSLMLRADELSTLNDSVAIQIDAADGIFKEKPITYRLWSREQFTAWCSPDKPCEPIVVCTIDDVDEGKRYRLWSDKEVWTFIAEYKGERGEPGSPGQLSDPVLRMPKEPHAYGCLPFTFIHYNLPIQEFFSVAIGEFLFKAELAIDNRLMTIDESITKYLNPIPMAKGVDAQWKPNVEPGRFVRMPLANPLVTETGYQPGEYATLEYLEAHVDVGGAWEDLTNYINQALEAAEIPKSAVRMEAMQITSGIGLMVEQEPLIRRAEKRRAIYEVYEQDLAYRTLWCAGNHYGKPELVRSSEAGQMVPGWPSARIAVLTQDVLDAEVAKVQQGVQSHLMMIQNICGCTRDQAIEHIKQVKADTEEVEKLFPEMANATALPDPEREHEQTLEQIAAKEKAKGAAA